MFCWDETKYLSNIEKHKVSFDLASLLFKNIVAELDDTRSEYGERRINAFGCVDGRMFVCTYTPRAGWRHIISLRKASKKEVKDHG